MIRSRGRTRSFTKNFSVEEFQEFSFTKTLGHLEEVLLWEEYPFLYLHSCQKLSFVYTGAGVKGENVSWEWTRVVKELKELECCHQTATDFSNILSLPRYRINEQKLY